MKNWFYNLVSDPAFIPVTAAWVAAFASIIGALVTIVTSTIAARTTTSVASRSVYINSVTAERLKWIDSLRRSIAEYSGVAERVLSRRTDPKYVNSIEWTTDIQSLRTHLSNLKLRLNPREPAAQNIISAARKLDQAARIHRWADVNLAGEIMVRHGQWTLKFEWNRVKLEAASGAEKRELKKLKAELDKEYRAFLASDGSLHRLRAIGAGRSSIDVSILRSEMDADSSASG